MVVRTDQVCAATNRMVASHPDRRATQVERHAALGDTLAVGREDVQDRLDPGRQCVVMHQSGLVG